MKRLLLIAILLNTSVAFGQGIYITDSTYIRFFSYAPVEDITAFNTAGTSIITVYNDSVGFRVPMTGFTFENKLMQEHFNENYLETEKYPYAEFQGGINEKVDLTKDTVIMGIPVSATGILEIHGVKQKRTLKGIMNIDNGKVYIKSEFTVRLDDHNIKIPRAVVKNIAEEIEVKVEAFYIPYKRKN